MTRKSPEESATQYPVGTRCVGNDNNIWEIIQASNGVQRWLLQERDPSATTRNKYKNACKKSYLHGKVWFDSLSEKKSRHITHKNHRKTRQSTLRGRIVKVIRRKGRRTKLKSLKKILKKPMKKPTSNDTDEVPLNKTLKGSIYITDDNGGKPFLVEHNGNKVRLFIKSKKYRDLDFDEKEEVTHKIKPYKLLYTDLVKEYNNVKKFFIGRDYSGYKMHGNSVLFELPGNRYVHVGREIYEFTTDEPVEAYHSYMGNNDVPYPVTLTNKDAYFMLDYVYVPRSEFPKGINWNDAYSAFYGHSYWAENDPILKRRGIHMEPQLTKKKFKHFKMIRKHDYGL